MLRATHVEHVFEVGRDEQVLVQVEVLAALQNLLRAADVELDERPHVVVL